MTLQGNGIPERGPVDSQRHPGDGTNSVRISIRVVQCAESYEFRSTDAAVDNPNFGRTFSALAPRLNQLGLKLYW